MTGFDDPAFFGDRWAGVYDEGAESSGPVAEVDFLASLARGGRVLELAIGTGRVGPLPLAARGIAVEGVEASDKMAAKLRAKPGGDRIPVVIGEMADVPAEGPFRLVYLRRVCSRGRGRRLNDCTVRQLRGRDRVSRDVIASVMRHSWTEWSVDRFASSLLQPTCRVGTLAPSAQSLVSLADGVMIRCTCEPKSMTRAIPGSTPFIVPRPYLSWVTFSSTEKVSAGGSGSRKLKGLVARWRWRAARYWLITSSMRLGEPRVFTTRPIV